MPLASTPIYICIFQLFNSDLDLKRTCLDANYTAANPSAHLTLNATYIPLPTADILASALNTVGTIRATVFLTLRKSLLGRTLLKFTHVSAQVPNVSVLQSVSSNSLSDTLFFCKENCNSFRPYIALFVYIHLALVLQPPQLACPLLYNEFEQS